MNGKKEIKRILMLNYEFPPLGGGASPVSYEIVDHLTKSGEFEIDVVTMGFKGLPEYEDITPLLHVHRVKCLRSRKEICQPWEQATYLVSGFFKCWQLLRKNKYHINHIHFIIPTGALSLILKWFFKLDYVITAHGSDVPGFNSDRFVLLHKFTRPFLKVICNNAKYIISPSLFLKGLILKNIDSKLETKIVHIPNGIDINKFTPKPKKNYILSTGRLLPRKGFQYLIQAVSGKDIGYDVHISGDGPMRAELEQLAKQSKTKIIFHGWLDNKGVEYKKLLEEASIFILVSSRENASIALLEAMAAGCAVITTDVSGCPETVSTSGQLIRAEDVADLRSKLTELVDDVQLRESIQNLARQRIENKFDWKEIIIKYSNLFKL